MQEILRKIKLLPDSVLYYLSPTLGLSLCTRKVEFFCTLVDFDELEAFVDNLHVSAGAESELQVTHDGILAAFYPFISWNEEVVRS